MHASSKCRNLYCHATLYQLGGTTVSESTQNTITSGQGWMINFSVWIAKKMTLEPTLLAFFLYYCHDPSRTASRNTTILSMSREPHQNSTKRSSVDLQDLPLNSWKSRCCRYVVIPFMFVHIATSETKDFAQFDIPTNEGMGEKNYQKKPSGKKGAPSGCLYYLFFSGGAWQPKPQTHLCFVISFLFLFAPKK